MTAGARTAVALGGACAFAVLLSPAVLPDADAALPAVLPLSFFAAGATALVLRPDHPVGTRLLAVGVLHLAGIAGALVVALEPGTWIELPVAWLSVSLYALGFVALLDLLARYPSGGYAWAPVSGVVRAAAVVAVVLAGAAMLGSPDMLSVLELDSGRNPVHVPVVEPLAPVVTGTALVPVAGLALLLARYRTAPALDRSQLRWPIVTAAVLALGLVTAGLAEDVLGPEVQAAVFVTGAAALPVSFLVGLLRHTEEAERLAAVEASRARLAEVADSERRRLERNLHDGAQQQILALLARVELARTGTPEDVERELREIGDDLRAVHRDLRELAQGVYPATLVDHGLAEAVRSALSRLPFPAQLTVAPGVERRRFSRPVEATAYFLVLEGLANAMKHAGAVDVRVDLDESDGVLRVTVSDSGPGFDGPAAGGSGLVGLRDRVAAVGGSLEVDSRPGGGTTVHGLLPATSHARG